MHHLHFNPWALLVSALILWFLGAAWYSPALFAEPWRALVKPKSDNGSSLMAGMAASLIGDLILSLILAHVVLWSGADDFPQGMLVGFIVWLGFFAAPNVAQASTKGDPSSCSPSTWAIGSAGSSWWAGYWRYGAEQSKITIDP